MTTLHLIGQEPRVKACEAFFHWRFSQPLTGGKKAEYNIQYMSNRLHWVKKYSSSLRIWPPLLPKTFAHINRSAFCETQHKNLNVFTVVDISSNDLGHMGAGVLYRAWLLGQGPLYCVLNFSLFLGFRVTTESTERLQQLSRQVNGLISEVSHEMILCLAPFFDQPH